MYVIVILFILIGCRQAACMHSDPNAGIPSLNNKYYIASFMLQKNAEYPVVGLGFFIKRVSGIYG